MSTTPDRRLWLQGFEHGYLGTRPASAAAAYARGHQDGAGAAQRRVEIRLRKGRDEARRDAAPELLGRLASSMASTDGAG